jgi:cytochrome P450
VSIPASIPRFVDEGRLRTDPLAFLRAAHATAGELVVISKEGPIFSRAPRCAGVVAAFGPTVLRQIFSDADGFGMAVSANESLQLPSQLARLNTALFSMRGEEHRSRQQLLTALLARPSLCAYDGVLAAGWEAYREGLCSGQPTALLTEMRRLVLCVATPLYFGGDALELGRTIQLYFDRRRTLSIPRSRTDPRGRRELLHLGRQLHAALHERLASLRDGPAELRGDPPCLLARLKDLPVRTGEGLTEDELVAHANVLFTSSSEPLAVALTWTLLLLSQHTEVREELRRELTAAFGEGEVPAHILDDVLPLLSGVIRESLRLLPPNAIMVRLTTKPAEVLGHELPADCEVVLSPFVAHRDAREYPRPDVFDPYRWRHLRPRAYTYFPFGVGARYCVGKELAGQVLLSVLARLLHRFDVVLARDQDLDWTMNVNLMPAAEPIVFFLPASSRCGSARGGQLGGPVATLALTPRTACAHA